MAPPTLSCVLLPSAHPRPVNNQRTLSGRLPDEPPTQPSKCVRWHPELASDSRSVPASRLNFGQNHLANLQHPKWHCQSAHASLQPSPPPV